MFTASDYARITSSSTQVKSAHRRAPSDHLGSLPKSSSNDSNKKFNLFKKDSRFRFGTLNINKQEQTLKDEEIQSGLLQLSLMRRNLDNASSKGKE